VAEDWQAPPLVLKLAAGDVHLWRWRLDRAVGDRPLFAPDGLAPDGLAPDEQLRADRFRFDSDRQRFIAARSGMRRILGRYLNRDPGTIEFSYASHGKPFLADRAIEFNLSHSGDWAVLAVAVDRAVGVDIERIKPMADLAKLTARFFVTGEHQRIMQLAEADRAIAFFRTWTCKEAYLKATGEGLGQLKSLEVVVQPQLPARLLTPIGWQLLELVPDVGYVGAVAASGSDWRVSFWNFEEK
jgi:4'-phosphopantetheinyl transferase